MMRQVEQSRTALANKLKKIHIASAIDRNDAEKHINSCYKI